MTFLRGAALTTATTLGYADSADLGPTAGNGFYRRWPDDLAALQDVGVTDLRLTLDWARLQPKPGALDGDWAERFEQILRAARAIDLRTWVTLHDGSIPRWLDNEGGLTDADALSTWWPRWVEPAADRYGDLADAWIPFCAIPGAASTSAWADTWGILGGGSAAVVASIGPDDDPASTISFVRGRCHRLGVALANDANDAKDGANEAKDDNGDGGESHRDEQWGNRLRGSAEAIDGPALVISGYDAESTDSAQAGARVERLVAMLDGALDDGVTVEACFVEPAIAGPDSSVGLLDRDRARTPIADAYLPV